jgi:hypothetical protein
LAWVNARDANSIMKGTITYRSLAVRLARSILLFIVLSVPILMLLENRVIYHPENAELPDADLGLSVRYCDFESSDGVKRHGGYVPAPHARGTIL